MFMTAFSFPPSHSSLSAISTFLSSLIQKDSHIDVNLLTWEQAQSVSFSVLQAAFTKGETLGQA